MIRVAEIFHSIQGEGFLTGTPSVFIRTSGCNLRCWFCDTRYASWEAVGETQSLASMLEAVAKWPSRHVVVTGGEPMIFDELADLCQGLRQMGRHITIETAGTVDRDIPCDLWSISPKLSNSTPVGYTSETWITQHDQRRNQPGIVESLMQRGEYQLKFVVGSILDAEEVLEYLSALKGWSRDRVMLMPRGISTQELQLQTGWLASWCRDHGLRLCDRLQIHWFGNRRGT